MMLKQKPVLPGYLILDVIGRGRASVVWAGRRESDDLPVAIKWIPLADPADESFRRRALEEAKAAIRIEHPATVPLLDAGEVDDGLYFVMEFIAGCTLLELLQRKGRLPAKHALTVAEGVALALTHAWDKERLLHHDLNPGNVMIEQDGTVRVMDLGIVPPPILPEETGLDAVDARFLYIAPEQHQAGVSGVDYRANIYSLGAIIYYMLTGRPPIPERVPAEANNPEARPGLPDPMDLNSELTPETAWLIEKMMVRDPLTRYRTWAEWLSDEREVVKGGSLLSEHPAAGQSVVRRSPRRDLAGAPRAPLKGTFRRSSKLFAPRPRGLKRLGEMRDKAKALVVKPKRMTLHAPAGALSSPGPGTPPPPQLSLDVFKLGALAVVALVAYGAVFYRARAPEPEPAPAAPVVGEPTWETDAVQPPVVRKFRADDFGPERPKPAVAQPPAAPARPAKGSSWQHPAFLSGARLFNDALAKYTQYLKDRRDPSLLTVIERQCREAIAAFESCRQLAPADVPMDDLVNQCYRLISDCRQLTLLPPPSSLDED